MKLNFCCFIRVMNDRPLHVVIKRKFFTFMMGDVGCGKMYKDNTERLQCSAVYNDNDDTFE